MLNELESLRNHLQTHDFSAHGQSCQNAVLDLLPHLKRLTDACRLAKDFSKAPYTGLHTYNVVVSLQYIYEYRGLPSFQKKEGTYTHDLRYYAESGAWDQIVGTDGVKKICQFNMKKGSDYPYWTYHHKKGKVVEGLQWITDSFSLSLNPESMPQALQSSLLVRDPYKFLLSLVEEHVPIIKKLLTKMI